MCVIVCINIIYTHTYIYILTLQCRLKRIGEILQNTSWKRLAVSAMICVHSPKDRAECLGGVVPIKGGALEWRKCLL